MPRSPQPHYLLKYPLNYLFNSSAQAQREHIRKDDGVLVGVGPKGDKKVSRKDDLLNLFRPILAQGGGKWVPEHQQNMKEQQT